MPSNPRLNQAIKQTLERLPAVIGDLQARPDYNKNPSFAANITLLIQFKQLLLDATVTLPLEKVYELQYSAGNAVLPLLGKLILANVAIGKMGPLNTKRTISPMQAMQCNSNLEALQNAVQALAARLAAALEPPPPPVDGRLLRLEVSGADEIGDGRYVADYAPGGSVTIRAIVEPSVPGVFGSLIWDGGEPGYDNDCRLLSCDRISGYGQPQPVAAWLGNTRLRVLVTVRPLLGGLDVGNAVKKGDSWIAHYSANGDPVTVRAAMMPDIPEAFRYLSWDGGDVDSDHPCDRRLVPCNAMTPPGYPLPVSATLGRTPKYEVRIEVAPRFTALPVSTEAGIMTPTAISGNTAHYTLAYGSGWIFINAVTEPDNEAAWSHIVWTGNAGVGGSPNCKTLARNALSPFGQAGYTITATVGDTVRTAVIKITPTLVSMQVSTIDRILDAIVTAGNVSDYSAGFALKQRITVTVTTDPDDKDGWAYIAWSGDGAKSGKANCRTLAGNVLTPFGQPGRTVKASVGETALIARIKVTPSLSALTIPLYAFATGIAQQWYSYRLAGPDGFNISNLNPKAVAQAVTVPNTAAAWAYLVWTDNGKPNQVEAGAEACLRTVRLDAANTVILTATLGDRQIQARLDIRAARQWPGSGPQLAVNTIEFSGGRPVTIDYATGSSLPGLRYCKHFPRLWHRANPGTVQEYPQPVLYQPPQAYTRNTPVGIAATIAVNRRPDRAVNNATIRAGAFLRQAGGEVSGLSWRQQVNIPAVGGLVIFPPIDSANLPNVILHEDRLLIFWELRIDEESWILFDVTEHCLYVTLGNPIPTGQDALNDPAAANCAYTLWSMLDISCAAGNGIGEDAEAAFGIYQAFQPKYSKDRPEYSNPMLKRKHDGIVFKYWHPCREPARHLTVAAGGIALPQLLNANGNGSSLPFAQMLLSMFGMHGIAGAQLIEVKPNPEVSPEAIRFLMRNWTFNAPPYANGTAYSHFMNNDGKAGEANGSAAGWAVWSPGAGQNSLNPPPALANHVLVRLEQIGLDIFFDPAYGSAAFANWLSWVSVSIAGLAKASIYKPAGPWYRFLTPPNAVKQPNAGFVKQDANRLPVVFSGRAAGSSGF